MQIDFDALGLELDEEQRQKILDAAKAAHDEDTAGLRAKRDELLDAQRKLKDDIKRYEGIDPERARKLEAMLAENEEAKLIADGKIEDVVNKRLSREQATWKSQLEAKDEEVNSYRQQLEAQQGSIIDSGIAIAASKSGLAPTAIEDAQVIARHGGWKVEDGVPVLRDKDGEVIRGKSGPITFEEWLEGQRDTRPHWFPTPKGSGAKGNRGGGPSNDNPWKKDSRNLTRQGQILRENPELAARLKAEAEQ